MSNTETKTASGFITGLVMLVVGSAVAVIGAFLIAAVLSIYGLPFSLAIFLVNALAHFYVGSAWLGLGNTLVIGYTLGAVAKLLGKVL